VVDVTYSSQEIAAAIQKQVRHGRYESDPLYGGGNASEKIVPVLADFNFKIQKRIAY
jgi:hypothetical protein